MITKNRFTPFNTTIRKRSAFSTLNKQILLVLVVILITVNLLVILFNFLLTAVGSR
ncbi:MAG: hypothetical protein PVH64_06700 [Bacillota bacterium]|jgi:hypothetical protein